MFSLSRDRDTICAVATAPGRGAISVVRLSGNNACDIARLCVESLPETIESHRVYYGFFRDADTKDITDEVLVTFFAEGKSFTCEDTIEISCHGSPTITESVLRNLISNGARLAQPGEFTYRAFKNGRIDLLQAESVLSLIESQSPQSARLAIRQLKGGLSKVVADIEQNLLWCLSRLEANIDFSAEDIEFAKPEEILERATSAQKSIQQLSESYKIGNSIKEGYAVAIVGEPNVGKSSLLNALVGEDRAIVSSLPGTTRDVVEATVIIDGLQVKLLDTAGVRETEDQIEKLGIGRTLSAANSADVICFVYNASETESKSIPLNITAANIPIVFVANKIDLAESNKEISGIGTDARTGAGISRLRSEIVKHLRKNHEENQIVVLRARQHELIDRCNVFVNKSVHLLKDKVSPEFVIAELQEALQCCFELLGKRFDDEVIDKVFRDFCLGK